MHNTKITNFKNLKGLKIIFSAEDFWPRLGGGEAFIDEFLTELAKNNEVHCIYIGEKKSNSSLNLHPISKTYAFKQIPLFNRMLIRQYFANKRWKKILRKKIKEINPDLIITQLIYMPASVEVAKEFDLPVVVFIHNYEHFSPNLFKGVDPLKINTKDFSYLPIAYKLQWPFYKWLLKWHESSLRKADLILPDTEYIVKILEQFYGIKSYAYFPVVDLSKYKIPKTVRKEKKEFITFVNPIRYKGADIVMKISEKMPEEKFLVVCGANAARVEGLKQLPNVTYLENCPDIKTAYAKTKLLIVPSTWPEPFGRVVMEAGINGIPSIVSPLGGLPEAAGKGGLVIDDLYDVDEWVVKIRKMKEKRFYGLYSRNAKKYAKKHSLKNQMNIFKKLLNKSIF